MALAHGEILSINELTSAMNGKSIRTWGKYGRRIFCGRSDLVHTALHSTASSTSRHLSSCTATSHRLLSVDNSNPDHPLARIEYNQKQLQVSTEFIDASFVFRVGSMLQFIGELSVSSVRSAVA